MNKDIVKGKWKQLEGSLRERWGKLTHDELDRIAGEQDKLVGRIQELYGESREQVLKALDHLVETAKVHDHVREHHHAPGQEHEHDSCGCAHDHDDASRS